MTEAEARAAVVTEAVSWYHPNPEADPRPTPFHLGARVKGVGVDCAQFILASVAVAGIGMGLKVQPVTPDWFMHHEDRRIIDMVEQFCHEVEAPQPGDLVLYFIGKSWAHMAIVKEWPLAFDEQKHDTVRGTENLAMPPLTVVPFSVKVFPPVAVTVLENTAEASAVGIFPFC